MLNNPEEALLFSFVRNISSKKYQIYIKYVLEMRFSFLRLLWTKNFKKQLRKGMI